MADFMPAFDFLMSHEDPQRKCQVITDNNGAETISGINGKFYQNVVDEIKALPTIQQKLNRVATFYHNAYWIGYFSRLTSQAVASKIFDMSVDMGLKEATVLAQRAANDVHFPTPGINDDGNFGPETFFSINAATEDRMTEALCTASEDFYREIASEHPDRAPGSTLNDWLARAADLPNAGAGSSQGSITQA